MSRKQPPPPLTKLVELRERSGRLAVDFNSLEFQTWRRDCRSFMTHTLGEGHRYIADFDGIRFVPGMAPCTPSYEVECFRRGITSSQALLDALMTELIEYGSPLDRVAGDPLASVRLNCARFHSITRQLRERARQRPALEIEDEYDVQYIMHALLRMYFDDIRPEEWTPSYAGGSARMDFLLKPQELVLETKKSRKGLHSRQLGEELIVDISKYKSHPSCKSLVCFVYDPEGRLANPSALMSDLSGIRDGIHVDVIIAPAH